MLKGNSKNKPCWCKSGKKFKKCHLGRESNPAPTEQQVLSGLRNSFSKKYCLHPLASNSVCNGKIIKAHTIQKNSGLTKIAEKQHVYQFQIETRNSAVTLKPKLIGINQASTFTGFCGTHDNKTFEPIEKHPFEFIEEHAFLLAYRSACRELFYKRLQLESIPFQRSLDSGRDLNFQLAYQMDLNDQESGVRAGLRDAEHYKKLYDSILLSSDFSNVYFYAIEFENTPDVMCSASKFVTHDFDGNVLQNLMELDKTMKEINFSLIATATGGTAIFSWIEKNQPAEIFVKSLDSKSDDEIPSALIRFTFEFFGNAFISPTWWNNLTQDAKDKIQNRFSSAVDIYKTRSKDCLKDDGLRPVNWKVIAKHKNFSFN